VRVNSLVTTENASDMAEKSLSDCVNTAGASGALWNTEADSLLVAREVDMACVNECCDDSTGM
jgi:hypothetical protein